MGFDTQQFTKAITGKAVMVLDWRNWIYGLISGMVGGASATGSAWMGMALAKGVGMDVQTLHWKELGIMLLTSGLVSAFAFLKQSPLPPKEEITTTTTTSTDVHVEQTKISPPPPTP